MSINATVSMVRTFEDDSGYLELDGPERGQPRLHFDSAPHEVTALNGLQVWGNASCLLLGDKVIAERVGYAQVVFKDRETFIEAVRLYHERQ
jgi:hypothetical protein